MRKSEFFKIHAYMAQSLKDSPLVVDNIRISIYLDGYFEQYLDVPSTFSDSEITELCCEVFDTEVDWEHFSEPHRFTGSPNRTPPATFNRVTYSYYC